MHKIVLGLIFGGKSTEHEVSVRSAKNVINAIDRGKYTPILIGIEKSGRFVLINESEKFLAQENATIEDFTATNDIIAITPECRGQIINLTNQKNAPKVDVFFPILHGPLGEDGTVQGLLKLANVPFVGAGVLGAAVGMDKDVMKRLLRDAKIAVGDFITAAPDTVPTFAETEKRLGVPCFIKPANAGSSVGVSKARNQQEYNRAVQEAFKFDQKIIIEKAINGREIECSVLGNDKPIAAVPGEIIANHDFYSYEAKYLDSDGARIEIPARISSALAEKVKTLAIKTYQTLCCEGLARVDFFLTEKEELLVIEINTLPGFTSISMYPMMWQASGISYPQLIDKLIQLAFERYQTEQKLLTTITPSSSTP